MIKDSVVVDNLPILLLALAQITQRSEGNIPKTRKKINEMLCFIIDETIKLYDEKEEDSHKLFLWFPKLRLVLNALHIMKHNDFEFTDKYD